MLLRTAAVVSVIVVVLAAVLLLPRLLLDWDLAGVQPRDRARAVNDIRDSLLKALGGLVVALGAWLTWRQLQVNRHGQITDAFASAITQLGDASLDVRLGGIYALERIARSSPADLRAIEEVLCLFVKNRASSGEPSTPCEIDVNTVLMVLGRRRISGSVRPLALDRTRLVDARLRYAHLAEADLHFADLTDAILRGADLTKADLTGAHLGHARIDFADLRGANLAGADLTEASLRGAVADDDTVWPVGFDPTAAGVLFPQDAPPIRPRNYEQAMAWPRNTGPDRAQP